MRYRWATADRPAYPYEGQAGYNTTNGVHEWWDGTRWVQADQVVRIHVKNTSGGTLAKGTPVYATGSVGASGQVEVQAADAANAAKMPALGLLEEELLNNGEGEAISTGTLYNVDTSAYSINGVVYVASGGGLTGTRPTGSTTLVQNIARVMRVHATTGTMLVMSPGRTNDVPNLIGTGYLATSGTADSTTFLRGDQTWATPTASATPGGSNTQVQFNDSGALGGDAGLTYNKSTDTLSTKVLTLGTAGSAAGSLTISGSTSGTITVQGAAAAGTYTLTLPTTDGAVDEVLRTDGSGVLSWVSRDLWTTSRLGSAYTTTSTSAGNAGLGFTPGASKRYLVEVMLLVQTTDATCGIRPGIAWPSGLSDGAAHLMEVGSTTANVQQAWLVGGTNAEILALAHPAANTTYMAHGRAYFITGGSPSGTFEVTLASETGAQVQVNADSFIRYREV